MPTYLLGKSFYEVSEFTSGMDGWSFRSWMPNDRYARCSVSVDVGCLQKGCLKFEADGRDDDGIFFVQKTVKAPPSSPIHLAGVRWSFQQPPGTMGAWPRVVYIGPPNDLARMETQHLFTWLDGRHELPVATKSWLGHRYHAEIPPGLDEMQVCIGWKINFETERTVLLDDIVIIGH